VLSAILGVGVLRLEAGQVLSLWDEVLPIEVRELPEDLARIDALLADPGLLAPIRAHWDGEAGVSGRSAVGHGRPTIAMATYVRLMVIKQRSGWGYETLVGEVSDSLHLRRFCLIAIDRRVPDESTIRKLTRRLGHETVDEITRLVIGKAQRETRFVGRAVRVDSTVIEADIRYPSDAMLALQGTRALAREGRKLAGRVKRATVRVRDRSRSVGRTVRQISKTLARRTGQAKQQVIDLNTRAGSEIAKSAREARRLAGQARRAARGRGAQAKLRAAAKLEQLASRCEKLAEQISRRARGLKITDRLVSISDPDARPIRKGRSASRPSSATSPRSPKSPRTPAAAHVGSSCRPPPGPATRPRTPCCQTRSPNSTGSRSPHARSSATAAFRPARRSRPSPTPRACSSPAATSPAPDAPASAKRATAPALKAASATSNAATASADPG